MPPVKPMPARPKRFTRYVGILFPAVLFDRLLVVRREDETVSDVVRRLCDEGVNGVNQGRVPQQK